MSPPDEIAVALVTAACVVGLDITFKNLLRINPPFLFSIAVPIYPFIVYLINRLTSQRLKHDALVWSATIVLLSALTLFLYAE